METKQERFSRNGPAARPIARGGERGNAMIYVLIVVILFAALTFTLSRQGNESASGTLSREQAEANATVILQTAMQVKQSVDMLLFSGSSMNPASPSALIFLRPGQAGFDTGPSLHKVFHADGGGLSRPALPDTAKHEVSTSPPAGWYLGQFNNVEWTPTTAPDIILTAHQIAKPVCEAINLKLTGEATIPAVSGTVPLALIDDSEYTGTNIDLTVALCPGCENKPSLCVRNTGSTEWTFYAIIGQQ